MTQNSTVTKKKQNTILLVEDHKYSLLVLTKMLQRSGFVVTTAVNGQEAVKLFKENSDIAIVLMDIKMPVMDGYIAMKEIKKIKPSVKVIAETAYALEGDKNKILNAGFDGYVSKPITQKSLDEVLGEYLK
jgi:CheY-like chemotaxis protein